MGSEDDWRTVITQNCPANRHFFLSLFILFGGARRATEFKKTTTTKSLTHRPGKTEGQNYPGFVIPHRALERKGIPAEDRRRSHSEAAGSCSRNSRLVFLQANFKKGIALIPCAFSIRRVPCAITAHAVQQLSVNIVHR